MRPSRRRLRKTPRRRVLAAKSSAFSGACPLVESSGPVVGAGAAVVVALTRGAVVLMLDVVVVHGLADAVLALVTGAVVVFATRDAHLRDAERQRVAGAVVVLGALGTRRVRLTAAGVG